MLRPARYKSCLLHTFSTVIFVFEIFKFCSILQVSYDPTTAKEMLLMAPSVEEQQFWVARLLKKIQKSGYKATGQVTCMSTFYKVKWHQMACNIS